MPTTADDAAHSFLRIAAKALTLAVLLVAGAFAFVFAFAAALVVGLMILGAAIALRFAPRPVPVRSGPEVLDAQRTPEGWVVETSRKS